MFRNMEAVVNCGFLCVWIWSCSTPSSSNWFCYLIICLFTNICAVTHASEGRCMDRVISGICDFVCVCVCTVKETPNLLHIHCMAGPQHVLTVSSEGQRSRSQCYEVCCRRGCACRYDCLGFWLWMHLFMVQVHATHLLKSHSVLCHTIS